MAVDEKILFGYGEILTRIEAGVKHLDDLLVHMGKPVKIEIKCSCCADTQREILSLLHQIKHEVFSQSKAAQAAELKKINEELGPAVAKLEQTSAPEIK